MAFTYNSLQALTQSYLAPRVVDATFKGAPFTYWLKDNGRLSLRGGATMQFPIIKAALNSDWYSGTDPATLAVAEPFTKAEFNWKFLRVPFVIAEDDLLKNMAENSADLLDATEQTATLTMIDALSTGLHGTNASNSKVVDGLQNMLGASATSYGGLLDTDFTSPAAWLANIYASGITSNTLATTDMRRMIGNVTRGANKPNLGLCNFATYGKIWFLAQTAQRFGMERIAKLGFDHMMFESIPIMADAYMPGSGAGTADNWLDFLNTDYIKLVIHEELAFKAIAYQPIPQQEVHIGKIKAALNLITTQRRAHTTWKLIDPAL